VRSHHGNEETYEFGGVLTDFLSFCNMVALLGGAVAQLGECLTGSQEVVGSNPISSTMLSHEKS
jgi:hypothetical protein